MMLRPATRAMARPFTTLVPPRALFTRAGDLLTRAAPRCLSTKAGDADHSWRQQNHIWTEAEVAERMKTADDKHVPQSLSETVLQKMVRVAYHTFNFATGYNHEDPP